MTHLCLLTLLLVCWSVCMATAKPGNYLKKPASWFADKEAQQIGSNILSHQSNLGGWPKNVSTTDGPYEGDRDRLRATYDNGATTDELRFLARIYNATKEDPYRSAFNRGLDYVLNAQYPNGGWPQYHPPGNGYARHITFNDHAMVRLMELVREIASDKLYDFVDDGRRKRAATAFDRGIDCILKCQIKVGGKLTAWCAQHDEVDLRPRPARSYELATLSGCESVGIARLLVSLDDPSPEVVNAVEAAAAWFKSAKLTGTRVDRVADEQSPKGWNKVAVQDANAPPLWARFYEIETNQPIFADRDGVPRANLADIGYERRNGYAWYGTWPRRFLEVEYPAWQMRMAANRTRIP